MDETGPEELYPMRTVAALTGVNPVTLRAWERRHALVTPRRGPGGHRLYTRADVNRLRRVVTLIEGGMSIRRAAAVVAGDDASSADAAPGDTAHGDAAPELALRLRAAVASLDEQRLERVYEEALGLYAVETVNERLVTPVLRELGERWSARSGGIAAEHFFTAFLRNKLGAAMHHLSRHAGGPRLLSACLPGERHDLGLLMFNQRAMRRGYRVTMLGAAVPLRELLPAVRAASPQAVVLGMTVAPGAGVLDDALPRAVAALPVPVLVGGARSEPLREPLQAAGARVLGVQVAAALDWLDDNLGDGVAAGRRREDT